MRFKKKGKVDALPLLSVDMLRTKTEQPYNEILLKSCDLKIKGIVFNQADWENALYSIELKNIDAISSMYTIIDSKLPIFIIKNNFVNSLPPQSTAPQDQLLLACKKHDLNLLLRLLKTIDARTYAGRALQEACYQGDLAIVQVLVAHGADINFENSKCLETAFYRAQTDIVKFLIAKGAKIEPILNQLEDYLEKRPNEELKALIKNEHKMMVSL